MEWSKNNLACTKTWGNLLLLKQHDETFKKAGKLMIKKLLFWNQTSSQEMREIMGRTICAQLDGMFRSLDGARYEKGFNIDKAIAAMLAILTAAEKTLCDLAEAVDNCYNFSEHD